MVNNNFIHYVRGIVLDAGTHSGWDDYQLVKQHCIKRRRHQNGALASQKS